VRLINFTRWLSLFFSLKSGRIKIDYLPEQCLLRAMMLMREIYSAGIIGCQEPLLPDAFLFSLCRSWYSDALLFMVIFL
jgi:hypothetical protein